MATEICITVEDDGTFTVEAEEASAEAQEEQAEPTGNEQKFKTVDEALAAAKQLIDSSSLAPPADQDPNAMPEAETPAEDTAPGEEEDAMVGSFRKGVVQ